MEITLPNNWTPRPYQMPAWSALEGGIKRALLFWHRRAGKDDLALNWGAVSAVQQPGAYWHMLPEYAQGRKAVWDAVNPHTGRRRIDDVFPAEIRESTRDQDMFIRLKSGATWQVVGSDNYNALVGTPPRGVVFSEWAIAKPEAWAYLRPILAENGGWAVFITTPRGKNHAYNMRNTYLNNKDWFVQTLSAADTNVFSEEQLNDERAEYIATYGEGVGRALFNQEYFCSFDSAVVGSVFGDEVELAKRGKRVTSIPYDKSSLVHTHWDIGFGDATAIICWQRVGREIRIIDYYESSGKDIAHYVAWLAGRGYAYGDDWLPFDADHGELGTGKSIAELVRSMGRNVRITPKLSLDDGIQAARMMFPRVAFDEQKTARLIDCLTQYRWELNQKLGELKPRPVHDVYSHGADAFRYLAVSFDLAAPEKKQKIKYSSKGIV